MRSVILSMGEALVDVLPAGDGLWRPVPGGSSYNVALALGRLGAPAAFVGRLSRDEQGERMTRALADVGVSTALVSRDERPSPLSLVERGSETASARYAIHLAGSAHAPPDLPATWPENVAHLHVSSFSAVVGDWGRAVGSALIETKGVLTRSFDVNIRPALLPDRATTQALVADRMANVELVKASEEDIGWLYPGQSPERVAADWSTQGLAALLTRGVSGSTLFVKGSPVHAAGYAVDVADTVGAGDVFMAAFLAQALDAGALQVPTDMDASRARALLDYANAAAALCCMRAGAEAPTRAEVETFIAASPLRGKSD